jgi:hypothetical protein
MNILNSVDAGKFQAKPEHPLYQGFAKPGE